MVGRDATGFYDTIVSHEKEAWQVKEHQVNPYQFVGFGSKVPEVTDPLLAADEHSFGLRPLSERQMRELMAAEENQRYAGELIAKFMSEAPTSAIELSGSRAVLQGPVAYSPNPLESISSAQARLDAELRSELRRLVGRRFRHTMTPYG